MKKNIWLALLCLSGGLSQNVMGSDKEFYDDLEKIETKVNMSADVLDAGDLEYVKKIIQKYSKNSTAVDLLMDRHNQIERKIKEKENKASQFPAARNVNSFVAPVAQQQNAGQVPADVKNLGGQNAQDVAQTDGLSDDDRLVLAMLVSKSVAEMTKEDFSTLDRLVVQKMSAEERGYLDNFLSESKMPLADRRAVVEKEGAVIAKVEDKQSVVAKVEDKQSVIAKVEGEQPVVAKVEDKQAVEQVTEKQITEEIKEFGRLNQMWIRRQGSMKPEEKQRFMELLNKKHIAKNYEEGALQRYKTEISKSLNDANVPADDRIQSNQLPQKSVPESAPEGPQNNVSEQQHQQNSDDEQIVEEGDVLGVFADLVKDIEEGKGSKPKKEREIKKLFSESSVDVIADDDIDIDEKVSKLNGLFDLFPKKNKKKQTNVVLKQLKIAAKNSNTGGGKFFRKKKAFDLFWKFCATTPAKERTDAFFNAACVRNEDEFIQFMTTRLSTDESSKKQFKALIQMLPEVAANLGDDSEVKLSKILARNVLGIDERNENAWKYIDQKEYKDVFKMLTNGKAFFEKEVKDIEKKLKKSEEEGDFDSLLNEVEGVISAFNDLIENGWIGKKDKPAIDKKLSSMKVRIVKKIDEDQQED